MEERAQYGPWKERPRLTVVHDAGASYSALPHAVLFSDLSDGAVRMYAVLQAHWWGDSGECSASHATLAEEARCSLKSVRRHLDELIAAGLIEERPAGTRRAKVYAPIPIGQKRPIEAVNTSEVSDCGPSNAPKTTVQSVKNDRSNAPKTTHSYKKTPVKKTLEEELPPTEVGAAVAASPPAKVRHPKKASRPGRTGDETPCPDTIPLTEQSYETAAKWGFDRVAVDFELEHFLESARANGRVYVDWKAAFRTWLLKAVQYAKRDNRPVGSRPAAPRTNGAGQMPPGAASKQMSSWADVAPLMGGAAQRGGRKGQQPDGR